MIGFDIVRAIEMQNLRVDRDGGPNSDKVTQRSLGRLFYPGAKPSTVTQSMYNITSGKTKKIDPEWIKIASKICVVDNNFIMGLPSKYDEEYDLLKSQEK